MFAEGRRAARAAMLVLARQNGLDQPRLGVSAGRRFGAAHRRNRARRLLREAFRLDRERLPAGYDFVIVPREAFPDTLADVRALLLELCQQAPRGAPSRPRPPRPGRKGRR